MGILTLEMVMESILQISILDEKDVENKIDQSVVDANTSVDVFMNQSHHIANMSTYEKENIWRPKFFKMYIEKI